VPDETSGADAAALYTGHLIHDSLVSPAAASERERYEALALSVRDLLSKRWILTDDTYAQADPKRVYYLSMEFLIGRSLANNLVNLRLEGTLGQTLGGDPVEWLKVLDEEAEPGLGNGGLGRLAACFLDSMATMQLPAIGYGLRYEYGMFRQSIVDGWQREAPDNWLREPDPWEIARPQESVEIKLGSGFAVRKDSVDLVPHLPTTLIGIPYDRPVVGYGGQTVNTLRLWAAAAPDYFDFKVFSSGHFVAALAESLAAETLTRVLYPDDSTASGQALRFLQEYFLVACSLADLIRRFRRTHRDWRYLPDKAAIQLNDTHPSLAVPELMRILLDDAHLSWDDAWDLTRHTLGYTNHTLLPEALERWPVAWFELMLPRQLEIIYEINRRLLDEVRARYPGDVGRVERISLIEEGATKHVRMANLAIVGSHSTNGVARIHSELLRSVTVRELAELYPERFNNKTNGVTPRRWLRLANPELSAAITQAIGPGWITDLAQLSRLAPLADDPAFRASFWHAKQRAKQRFSEWLMRTTRVEVDPSSVFDCQVKRIHEYKRQLLNVLRIIVLYQKFRADPSSAMPVRTFYFAGKAAPAYQLAKLIIKLINNVAEHIAADPGVSSRMKVVFLAEYEVSLAERLAPAADVSNQISTAGYEASGTSNMKFMMNGALTLGTRDGATIEMVEKAGEENFFLFGLTAAEVAASRAWYRPQWHYEHEPETRAALDAIFSDTFSPRETGIFEPLRDALLGRGDFYMNLADLRAYLAADERLCTLYGDRDRWARTAILNVAASGWFSSDRTIGEYASEIWGAKACPVVNSGTISAS
jgi:starch phosphorylase